MLDWFDVAPAVVFAVVAGGLARFIGGKPTWAVLLGVGYIVIAGFVAAAAMAYVGLDGFVGFAASTTVAAVLIAPLWLYTIAADRTPVEQAEIDEAIADADAIVAQVKEAASDYDTHDAVDIAYDHLGHIVWRLPKGDSRRPAIRAAARRLEDVMEHRPRRKVG